MFYDNKLWIAKNDNNICVLPSMANRHGLICGATGTGKTITLKVLAESFSDAGVPVFVSDIKGDLSGMSRSGEDSENMRERIARFGLGETGFAYKGYPTAYWDVFGKKGTPVRAAVSEMGPLLLGRILELNDVQEGVLNIIFRIADDQNLLLLDLKDLKAMTQFVGDNAAAYKTQYGNISTASVGAILRAILKLEDQGGDIFFGEPALDIRDWIRCDSDGRGYMNIMNCEELFQQPSLYAAFLLWMLSEIYNMMPEVGDPEKPKFVFFFDEAHLLFNNISKAMLDKVEQVVRLIRSKGVGIYFISQNPTDMPDNVLSQLGNRIEHALRAYSPAELKNLRAAAQTFRPNPAFDTAEAIQSLGTGEAVIQVLDEDGIPKMAERAFILPPQSLMGPVDPVTMAGMIATGDMGQKYNEAVDRESAYELLTDRVGIESEGVLDEDMVKADLKEVAYQAAYDSYMENHLATQASSAGYAAAEELAEKLAEEAKEQAAAFRDENPDAPIIQAPGTSTYGPDAKLVKAMATEGSREAIEAAKLKVAEEKAALKAADDQAKAEVKEKERLERELQKAKEKEEARKEKEKERKARDRERVAQRLIGSAASSIGGTAGRKLARGILGSLLK